MCGVCMYAHHTLCVVYAHHTWNTEEVTSCSALSPCTLCLSVDLELAWQQASASGPPVSTLYSVGVPGYVAMPGLGAWVWVLTLAQEVLFPLSGLPNLSWYHCSIFMCKRLSLYTLLELFFLHLRDFVSCWYFCLSQDIFDFSFVSSLTYNYSGVCFLLSTFFYEFSKLLPVIDF